MLDDATGIPWSSFHELLGKLPRGHPHRAPLLLLALTGCRVCEITAMHLSNLHGNVLYWRVGKNQTGYRKESLPIWFLRELDLHRKLHPVRADRLTQGTGESLRRCFNKDVRPILGPDWQVVRSGPCAGPRPYVLSLKGFRKSFATTIFWREFQKWQDAGVALEFASKRLRHSTKGMTAHHYLKEFSEIEVESWDRFLRGASQVVAQAPLAEYLR